MTTADWRHRGDYMSRKHGVTPKQAEEALTDPARLTLTPDPSSRSGRNVRTIGWCESRGQLLTIITVVDEDGMNYGVNGWEANLSDQRKYDEKETGP